MHKRLLNYIPKADGGATILLYGDVGGWGDIDSQRVVTELLALENQYSSIDVRINSGGGDVYHGIAIFNALRNSKADIKIYVDGIAASIAGVIALCGKPLYMSQYARLMLHKVSGGAYGSAKELRETAELIEQLEGTLAEMIAGRIGKKKEEVLTAYFEDNKDHWMTATEALSMKIIDGIHDLDDAPAVNEESTTEDVYKAFNNRLESIKNHKNKDMALLDDIRKIPAFANATEADVTALLKEQATKLEANEQDIASLKAKLADVEAKEVEALLNSAVSDGRITEEQKPHYAKLLDADRSATEALLNSLPKAQPKGFKSAKEFTQSGGPVNKFAGKTWAELDKAGLLNEFKTADKEGFARAYKEEFGVDYQF